MMDNIDISIKVYEAAANKILMKSYYDVEKGIISQYTNEYPEKSVRSILNDRIGSGCGGTLTNHIDGIWAIDFFPGIRIIAVNNDLKNITLNKRRFIDVAERILRNQYLNTKQLVMEF